MDSDRPVQKYHPYLTDGDTVVFLSQFSLAWASFGDDIRLRIGHSQTDTITSFGPPTYRVSLRPLSTLTVTASDGTSITFFGPVHSTNVYSDSLEPYQWETSNQSEITTFANNLGSLTDHAVTLTLDDNEGFEGDASSESWSFAVPAATGQSVVDPPVFSDPTGDAQTWTAGVAITPIVIPSATGDEPITYAVVGSLPDGIVYEPGTLTQRFDMDTSLILDASQGNWSPTQADEDIDDRFVLNSGTELSLFCLYSDGGIQLNLIKLVWIRR